MKILGVRFKNLNSLTGEWNIDFTHPDYSSNGIFAITGPTGSGKTTILDAVCLGLYGRTPRLDKVTKNSNEIMSRQAGECFAEVTFETQKGRFRCHWSQRRARKKPEGELQQSRHEVSNADSGVVLESRIAQVSDFIENATGMNFDRFTRSMLLAQGGFDAFLQAPPGERSPILEQITGTEIYSRISIQVHERFSEERGKLEYLQAELKGIQVLSEEEIADLNLNLNAKKGQQDELAKRLDKTRNALNWLTGISNLERELQDLQIKWKDYEERRKLFDPDARKLERSRKALTLEGDYGRIIGLRSLQETEAKQLAAANEIAPEKDTARLEAVTFKEAAEARLNEAKTKLASESEVIKKVRDLDVRISEQKVQLEEKDKALAEIAEQEKGLLADLEASQRNLLASRSALKTINEYIEQHASDAGLVTSLSAIARGFESLREIESKLVKSQAALSAAADNKQTASEENKSLAAARESMREAFEKSRGEVQGIAEEISIILKGREISDWREETDTLKDRERLLVQTNDAIIRMNRTGTELGTLRQSIDALIKQQSSLSDEITAVLQEKSLLETDIEHLETQRILLLRIRNLEEDRKSLEDGKPCPLCGATEHPFASGNIPELSAAESALKKKKTALRKVSEKLGTLEAAKAKNESDIQHAEKETGEKTSAREVDDKAIADALLTLNIGCAPKERDTRVNEETIRVRAIIAENSRVIADVEKISKKEKSAQISLDKKRTAFESSEKALQDSIHKLDTIILAHEQLTKECASLNGDAGTALFSVLKDVEPFGISQIKSADLDGILQSLTDRRDSWLAKQDEKSSLEKKVTDLAAGIETNKALFENMKKDLLARQSERQELNGKYESLCSSRQELFGDKNPDSEEKALADLVQQAGTAFEQARVNLEQIDKEIAALKEKIRFLTGNIDQRKAALEEAEQKMSERIKTAGFENEADYLSSRLSEEDRDALEEQEGSLNKEKSELETRLNDKAKSLAAEREKNITDETFEKLQENLNAEDAELKQIGIEIGGIMKTLSEDEKMKEKQLDRIRNIEAQKKELARWADLHVLIGSADGKKFRNFAQGLTFEMVAMHANRQLRKMTDRYILVRDNSQPLELNVIDNYQAGEVRSTKNLSGGESFIVSLALALGLSHMASQNVRVDSLFLDEGFGTLDEDSLETALETLAGLQQDGKLIGVISHVPAFKERISTQIQVIPEAGGKSRITGPGCCQV